MKTFHCTWESLNLQPDQTLPNGIEFLILGSASTLPPLSEQQDSKSVASVVELTTPEVDLLTTLPLVVILSGIPDRRLGGARVTLPVSGNTVLDGLSSAGTLRPLSILKLEDSIGTKASFPALTPQPWLPISSWRKTLISLSLKTIPGSNRVGRLALEAGLLLLTDDLDASHRCSQAIEGAGVDRPGDYWHAIMHRREPDASNSKYWFRNVGEHPIFQDLLTDCDIVAKGSGSADFRRWATRQQQARTWDPFAFVDVCTQAAASGHREFQESCEQMQYREMLRLLSWTWHFASNG